MASRRGRSPATSPFPQRRRSSAASSPRRGPRSTCWSTTPASRPSEPFVETASRPGARGAAAQRRHPHPPDQEAPARDAWPPAGRSPRTSPRPPPSSRAADGRLLRHQGLRALLLRSARRGGARHRRHGHRRSARGRRRPASSSGPPCRNRSSRSRWRTRPPWRAPATPDSAPDGGSSSPGWSTGWACSRCASPRAPSSPGSSSACRSGGTDSGCTKLPSLLPSNW